MPERGCGWGPWGRLSVGWYPHQTFMSLGQFWREAEGGEERGVQKGRHIGNEHTRRRELQGEHLNTEGPRGTARSSRTIDSKCRAAVGPRGEVIPGAVELRPQTGGGLVRPYRFSPLTAARSTR